jgi:CBS domain-containing membrane protein
VPDALLAASLAGCLAITAMFALRCLHPPGGAVALTAVLGGHTMHEAGFDFAFTPVALNSALIVAAALLYNNLIGRRYPHAQHAADKNAHATGNPTRKRGSASPKTTWERHLRITAKCSTLVAATCWPLWKNARQLALARHFRERTCAELMSTHIISLTPRDTVDHARTLLLRHHLQSLPVLGLRRHILGVLSQEDLLRHAGWEHINLTGDYVRQ